MSTDTVKKHEIYPHIEWVDLDGNGVAQEIVVMKRDPASKDLYYIKIADMDEIDRNRLVHILQGRDSGRHELWDVLHNTTLANGENALEFFHQMVKVQTRSGVTMLPGVGRHGIPTFVPERGATQTVHVGPNGQPINR